MPDWTPEPKRGERATEAGSAVSQYTWPDWDRTQPPPTTTESRLTTDDAVAY